MPTQYPIFGLARGYLESTAFLEIKAEEHAALLAAKQLVVEVLAFEEKFDLVVSNYIELEKTLNDLAAEYMIRHFGDYHSGNDDRVLLNQRVQNFLSAVRLYQDHGAHHSANLESVVPNLSADFRSFCSQQYDASDSYRIAEALRNHSQHRGFPINTFTSQNGWIDRAAGRDVSLHRIDMYLDAEAMIQGGKIKAQVITDLQALGDKPDARPILREYMDRLGRIHTTTRERLQPTVEPREALIEDAIKRFEDSVPHERSSGHIVVERRDADGRVATESLFKDLLERRRKFQWRNASFTNLVKRHVSSEPPPPRS